MAGRFSIEAVFKAVDRITAPVTRMQNRVGKFTRATGDGFRRLNRVIDRTDRLIKRTARVGAAAGVALAAGAANVIGVGATFEQTLVKAAALFPGQIRKGTKAFEELEAAALKTGETTEFTASQAAKALEILARGGIESPEFAIKLLPAIVDMATVADVTLGEAAGLLTKTQGAAGLDVGDAEAQAKSLVRVSDVMAMAASNANTTIQDMFLSIRDGMPAAVEAGMDLESVLALFGQMADAGIESTKAGTAMKRISLAISAPTSPGAQALKDLGVEVTTGEGENKEFRDIVDILKDIDKAREALPETDRAAPMKAIFGEEGLTGATKLVNSAEKLAARRDKLYNSDNFTKNTAEVIRDTIQGRINALKSAIEGVNLYIFGNEKGPLSNLLDRIIEAVRSNKKEIGDTVKDIIENLKTAAKFIRDNSETIWAWTKVIFSTIVAFKLLNIAVGAFDLLSRFNPVLLIFLAIGTAAWLIYQNWETVVALWQETPGWLQVITVAVGGVIAALAAMTIGMAAFNFVVGLNPLVLIVAGIVLAIAAIAAAAYLIYANWDSITAFFSKWWEKFKTAISGVGEIIATVFADMWAGVSIGVGAAWVEVTVFVERVFEKIKSVGDSIGTFFKDMWARVLGGITAIPDKIEEVKKYFGFGGDDEDEETAQALRTGPGAPPEQQVVSPAARTAKEVAAQSTNSTAEVTIRDETARAEVTKGRLGPGLSLQYSGAFD